MVNFLNYCGINLPLYFIYLLFVKDFLQLQLLTQRISQKLAEQQNNVSEDVRQFLRGENSEVVNRALLDYLSSLESNIHLETREEDYGWFNGLHEKYQTKEAVMKDGARTRIRNYYQKTREYMLEQVKSSTFIFIELFYSSKFVL